MTADNDQSSLQSVVNRFAETDGAPISFQLPDGTRFTFDPDNNAYTYGGEIVVPIVRDQN